LTAVPRFSNKDVLRGIALIAVGAASLMLPQSLVYYGPIGFILAYVLWFIGGAMIGAGLLPPINKPWVGASLCVLVQFLYLGVNVVRAH